LFICHSLRLSLINFLSESIALPKGNYNEKGNIWYIIFPAGHYGACSLICGKKPEAPLWLLPVLFD